MIVLDARGENLDSPALASAAEAQVEGKIKVDVIIGGPAGWLKT